MSMVGVSGPVPELPLTRAAAGAPASGAFLFFWPGAAPGAALVFTVILTLLSETWALAVMPGLFAAALMLLRLLTVLNVLITAAEGPAVLRWCDRMFKFTAGALNPAAPLSAFAEGNLA